MNNLNNEFKKLSDLLKGNTPTQINELLNNLGVSKDEILKKINNTNQEELLSKIKKSDLDKTLKNLSPEEIERLKHINKDEIGELYKNFLKSKQGN